MAFTNQSVQELSCTKQAALQTIEKQYESGILKLLQRKMMMHQKLQSDLFKCVSAKIAEFEIAKSHYNEMSHKLENNYKTALHKLLTEKNKMNRQLNDKFSMLILNKVIVKTPKNNSFIPSKSAGFSFNNNNFENKSKIKQLKMNKFEIRHDQFTKPLCMPELEADGNESDSDKSSMSVELISIVSSDNKIANDKKYFKCLLCENSFASDIIFGDHVKQCGYNCKKQKRDMRHLKNKKMACNQCKKSFQQLNALIIHIRIHTGEKPYKCNYCAKSFRQSCHLIRHKRLHTGEKPYECNYCNKRFSSATRKSRHFRKQHNH